MDDSNFSLSSPKVEKKDPRFDNISKNLQFSVKEQWWTG